ncbi:hypothetical protein HWI79_3429 [Cryptosporidium felis]|nr:hypothetical protein HWI79_3429 [Cryptosporidium felis]
MTTITKSELCYSLLKASYKPCYNGIVNSSIIEFLLGLGSSEVSMSKRDFETFWPPFVGIKNFISGTFNF